MTIHKPIGYVLPPSSLTVPTRIYAVLGMVGGALAILAGTLAVLAKVGGLS